MESKIRVGIVGCGTVARIGHAPWYRQNPAVELVAAADPNEKHLEKFSRSFKIQKQFKNPLDLIESGEIDALSICSPHWAHREQIVASLKRGLHVLVEKPMAVSMDECDEIEAAVRGSKSIFQVASQKRFERAHQRIKEALEKGEIGDPFQASIYWYHYIPDLSTGLLRGTLNLFKKLGVDLEDSFGAWRLTDARAGGGDLMDHLPHYYDLFKFWLGEPELLSAEIARVYPGRVHEDHGLVAIKYKSGALGLVERSQDVKGRPFGEERGYVHGTRGSIYWDAPHEYTLKPVKLQRYSGTNIILNKRSPYFVPGNARLSAAYKRQVDAFIARIRNKPEAVDFPVAWVPGYADGRAHVEGVIASYISSLNKRKVELPLKKSEYQGVRFDFERLQPVLKKES
nr:Gfo/Idh/MocA family oxidoreductase [Candidatus Sigynarchaeum springense]